MATAPTPAPSRAPSPTPTPTPSPAPAPPSEPGPGPAPEGKTGPPAAAYVTVWVHKKNVAAAGNQMGFVQVLKAAGDAMIAAGQAVIADGMTPYPYMEGTEPQGWPPPPPVVTVAITAISQANPAIATLSAADVGKLSGSTSIAISGATGTDAALVNKTFPFVARSGTTIELTGLDNSTPLSFGGYPLTGTKV